MFHQLSHGPAARARGFTLIELLIGMSILGIMLALAIPGMGGWLVASKGRAASEFYLDGFAMARRQAVSHNSASRIQLTVNPDNGQLDWQVDICFPVPGTPCNTLSGTWSTVDTPAAGDPQGAAGFKSVFRAATGLPPSEVLLPSTEPEGATSVYYTPLGWVDTAVANRLTQLRLDPAATYAHDIPVAALAISLAGMPTKCDPTLAAGDSRACPP
jgi:type IV fimbrial biogenesis protein FimT